MPRVMLYGGPKDGQSVCCESPLTPLLRFPIPPGPPSLAAYSDGDSAYPARLLVARYERCGALAYVYAGMKVE